MSSSFGELVGLCHFRHSQVTPAISSSGGKGGNGTLHEVNRSTTSLNSLGRAERDRGWERMGERDRRDRVRDTHAPTDGDSEWKKQQHKNGQQRGCYPGNNQACPTLRPCHFWLQGGRSILKLVKALSPYTASELHSSTAHRSQCPSPSENIVFSSSGSNIILVRCAMFNISFMINK